MEGCFARHGPDGQRKRGHSDLQCWRAGDIAERHTGPRDRRVSRWRSRNRATDRVTFAKGDSGSRVELPGRPTACMRGTEVWDWISHRQ